MLNSEMGRLRTCKKDDVAFLSRTRNISLSKVITMDKLSFVSESHGGICMLKFLKVIHYELTKSMNTII